ncbi:MAG TPA: hypothetical protein VIV40_12950, partial [Kofleriaceae bacterium]
SHWGSLGVSGVVASPDTAVDPEALILLTAVIGEHDPRLQGEALDWCSQFARRFIAAGRLKALAKRLDNESASRVHAFAAVVNEMAGTHWASGAMSTRRVKLSGKSRLTSLDTAPRSLLRLRCVFGVNARAEILLWMITQWNPSHYVVASALTELGYVKSAIAATLDDLTLAGITRRRSIGNANAFSLKHPGELRGLLEPLPLQSGQWHVRMPLLIAAVRLEESIHSKPSIVKSVEGRKFVDDHADVIARLALTVPPVTSPAAFWEDLRRAMLAWFR